MAKKKPTKKKPAKTTALARRPKTVIARSKPGRPGIIKLPDGAEPKRAHVLSAKLRTLAAHMTQEMFEFMDAAAEMIDKKHYTALHFQDPDSFFEQYIGFSWRSLRRRLAIHEAVKGLDRDEIREARAALIGLGIHRAAILAPALKAEPTKWRGWVTVAKRCDEDDLQERVSKALGLKGRGKTGHDRSGTRVKGTDEKWLEDTLKVLPEDARAEVSDVFSAGLALLSPETKKIPLLQVFLNLCREAKSQWFAEAQSTGWKPKAE